MGTIMILSTKRPRSSQLPPPPPPLLQLLFTLTLCVCCARLGSAGVITTTAAALNNTAFPTTYNEPTTKARAPAVVVQQKPQSLLDAAVSATTMTTRMTTRPSASTAVTTDERQRATQLGIWGTVRSAWHWLSSDLFNKSLWNDDNGDNSRATATSGRTFGKIRRLQMALIPIIFKFGVLSAMVALLVLLALKTLFLLKVLVMMNALAILGKFITLKANFGHMQNPSPIAWGHSGGGGGWSQSPAPQQQPSKEIHLHIHGGGQPTVSGGHSSHSSYGSPLTVPQGWERRSDPYAAYVPAPVNEKTYENEWNSAVPIVTQVDSSKYVSNYRIY